MLVIGVGNRYRSDDGAGLEVARRLQGSDAFDVRESEGEPVALLDVWDGAPAAILVDAVSSGATPGTIHRIDASDQPLPAEIGGAPSTHAVGLGEAIELGRALGRLPRKLIVYGIEGERFNAGEELSPRVAAAIESLVQQVQQERIQPEEGRPKA
ncbi:MAG: hydrogenase maturation protease [Solirubrobacteraceae bacterium]|jgi:hydrogenase maturation protease